MTRKQKRFAIIMSALSLGGFAIVLILIAAQDNLLYFQSPTDLAEGALPQGQKVRLGGMVAEGSVLKGETTTTMFTVTDYANSVQVSYDGILPDLFRECQGVVTEGRLQADGTFIADTVLAKHDESYMPPEVAEALKNAQGGREIGCETAASSPSMMSEPKA